MPITTCMTDQFRQELFEAVHNFKLTGGHDFRFGLFNSTVTETYDKNTATYTDITGGTNDELSASGYTAKGELITRVDPTHTGSTTNVAYIPWTGSITWSTVSFSSNGAFCINDSHASDSVVSLHDFGETKTSSSADFIITMPTADATNAILRLA